MPRLGDRGIETIVGIAAGVIGLAAPWLCYWFFIWPLPPDTEGVLPWALMSGVAPFAAALAVDGARLLRSEPRLRRRYGRQRLTALAVQLTFIALLGFWRGTVNTIAMAVTVLLMLGGVVRGIMLNPRADGHE